MSSKASSHRRTAVLGAILAGLTLALAGTASAQGEDHGRHDVGRHDEGRRVEVRPGIYHGDIAHFHEHDWAVWRGGHWFHDRHDGRFGWWWVVNGAWYFYPAPVYPYPNPYEPPIVVAPGAPPPARAWYYCDANGAYYPYAATCPSGWRMVAPNTPPGPPPQ